MQPSSMRIVYNIMWDYELHTAHFNVIKMYSKLSEAEIKSALNGLYLNGYLDKVEGDWYKRSEYFADDSNLK